MTQEYLFMTNEFETELRELANSQNVDVKFINIINKSEEVEKEYQLLQLKIDGESIEVAKALDKLNDEICKKYNPAVVINDSSAFFSKILYPIINDFERKLRYIICLVCANVSSDTPNKVLEEVDEKDLGELFEILFADVNFVRNVREKINQKTWKFTRDEIIKTIDEIEERTLWDEYLGEDFVPTLRRDFVKVRFYRNAVMHMHNINFNKFEDAKELFETINVELDEAIKRVLGVGGEKMHISLEFNDTLETAFDKYDNEIEKKDIMKVVEEFLYKKL